MTKILIVCAHPDDETLGMGGTIYLHTKKGDEVFVLIFSDGESARGKNIAVIKKRQKQAKEAFLILGIKQSKFLNYKDQTLDNLPLSVLSKDIEDVIRKWKPEIVFTHFWGDVNQDHRAVYEATKIASRPTPGQNIKKVLCFETPSSTEWGLPKDSFNATVFVNIEKSIKKKIMAFQKYKGEIMKYPHSRSIDGVINRASYWGNTVGMKYAETFILIRELK